MNYCDQYPVEAIFGYPILKIRPPISIETLMTRCCNATGVTIQRFLSRNRQREAVHARMIFCYELRRAEFTLGAIGELVNRDHTSIIHSLRTFNDLVETKNEKFMEDYNRFLSSETFAPPAPKGIQDMETGIIYPTIEYAADVTGFDTWRIRGYLTKQTRFRRCS